VATKWRLSTATKRAIVDLFDKTELRSELIKAAGAE
jgi:hypothetical protein